jgi:hypothetical protein
MPQTRRAQAPQRLCMMCYTRASPQAARLPRRRADEVSLARTLYRRGHRRRAWQAERRRAGSLESLRGGGSPIPDRAAASTGASSHSVCTPLDVCTGRALRARMKRMTHQDQPASRSSAHRGAHWPCMARSSRRCPMSSLWRCGAAATQARSSWAPGPGIAWPT